MNKICLTWFPPKKKEKIEKERTPFYPSLGNCGSISHIPGAPPTTSACIKLISERAVWLKMANVCVDETGAIQSYVFERKFDSDDESVVHQKDD